MDIKEIKKEFGDCDWLRAFLNEYTVEAIIWMINELDIINLCDTCTQADFCTESEKEHNKECSCWSYISDKQ